ncbi:hypothetical protein V500_00022 [Pseudogymnoascus sp. VKM F-4518 (FW-2643)]|nr:hypothetical protein V500_00022 [Pseudogymnoascus sp. VKM F-4518 (FW-2643)]
MPPPPPLIYAELLPNIRQISVLAALPTPSGATTRVSLSKDRAVLTLVHNGATASLQLPGAIAPTYTPTQPHPALAQLSWRIPLVASPSQQRVAPSLPAPWSANALASTSSFSCRGCGQVILPPGRVTLWRDLPSENWAEMMEFWHCHKPDVPVGEKGDGEGGDNTTKGYGANTRMMAQRGVGKVDLTYFLLDSEDCSGLEVRIFVILFLLGFFGFYISGIKKAACQLIASVARSPIQMPQSDPSTPSQDGECTLSHREWVTLPSGFSGFSMGECLGRDEEHNPYLPTSRPRPTSISCKLPLHNQTNPPQTNPSSLTVTCTYCAARIGTSTPAGYQLYKWSLSLTAPLTTSTSSPTSQLAPTSPPLPHFILPQLHAQSSALGVSKFIIRPPPPPADVESESDTDAEVGVYVWLFAPSLTVSFSSLSSRPISSHPGPIPTNSSQPTPLPASKLLFRPSPPRDEATALLDAPNSAVEELRLPASVVRAFTTLLQESNARLPEGARAFAGGWDVGILEVWDGGEGGV